MNTTHGLRPLVVVITFIACSAVMAEPAAATPSADALTAGEITFTKTGMTPEVLDLSPGSSGTCIPPTIEWERTSSTIRITQIAASKVVTFGATGTFLVVLSRTTVGWTDGSLTSSTTAHTITNVRVGVQINVYNTVSCTPTGSAICNVAFILNLSGTATSFVTSGTKSLTGGIVGSVVAYPTCTLGPSQLIGAVSTVTGPITTHQTS